jgi:tetratricopeptide (TPR) repeat protein
MSIESRSLKELFLAALAVAPAERAAWLEHECGPDAELRRRVELMLAAHDTPQSLLDRLAPAAEPRVGATGAFAAGGAERLSSAESEVVGTVIAGRYKLVEEIGEGGMGTVWMAQQTEPVKRVVALKVIKAGMDSKQVLARFDAERQALALMDHPHIARVLDAGATAAGRPFFVMELVKGVPLTKYCDEHRLTPRQRLELFIPVCQAIQHAHQKGIIHRDIKPSNVLVALYDGKPVPKVIDFGVAKATGQQLTEHTLVTGFGAVVGTLEYMSPEQAELNQLDIDTRSDIYSLGVLLYELLTGTTPLDRKRLKEAALLEVLRVIREEEPPKPSTRLSTTEEIPSIAANRGLEPRKLSGLVRGELDWIVMKALEKDRNRRYETANGFAQDIQRYLADEPVQACPPSAWYRLRKFARRHKTGLAVAGLVLFFIAVVGATLGWAVRDRAAAAEQAARDRAARQEKLEGRINQALEETQAEYERDNLPEARARIQRIEALLSGDADVSDGIRQRVDEWRAELAILQRLDDLALLPFERSKLLQRDADYARIYRDIGIDIDAVPADEAGRRIRTHVTWKRLTEALDEWASLRHDIAFNKPPPPDAWLRKLRLFQVARAADPDELRNQARLAAEKWDLAAAERLAGLPEVGRLPPAALRHVAMVIYYGNTDGNTQSARDRAVRLLLNALVLRPGDFHLNATCANWYGRMEPPRWAEAAHYGSIAVALRPENPDLRLRLAGALRGHGLLDDAIAIAQCREAIRIKVDYAAAHDMLGSILLHHGKFEQAIVESRKAIALDPQSASAHVVLGDALRDQGKVGEAIFQYRKAIRINKDYTGAYVGLGGALIIQGRLDQAIAECRKAITLDPKSAGAHNNLGNALRDQGKLGEAIVEYHKAIAVDPKNALAHNNLGVALRDQGKLDEAIAEYQKAIQVDPKCALAHNNLGVALRDQGKLGEAIIEYHKAIAVDPKNAEAHGNLGHALKQQGEFLQALVELRRSHEIGSKHRHWKYPSDRWVRECERLVELDGKLPDFIEGKATPASAVERIELALLCQLYRKQYAAAARFYEEAFTAERKLSEQLNSHRYNASCAAALAGCGQGKGADKLDEKEKARLRRRALAWLRADLEAMGRLLDNGADPARLAAGVGSVLRHWLADPDFAGVRGPQALANLPDAERQPWQQLWNDVADLLKRAQGKATSEKK